MNLAVSEGHDKLPLSSASSDTPLVSTCNGCVTLSSMGACKEVPLRSTRFMLRVVLRNSVYALLGRILLGIIKLLARRGVSSTFWRQLSGEFFSLNPLKWAAVFGGWSSFRLCERAVYAASRFLPFPPNLTPFAAGCLCSLPVLVMNRQTRTELCLYVFVRSVHAFTLKHIFPLLPSGAQRFDHYDVLAMCLSASQISYAFIYAPRTLPPAYQQFVAQASMLDQRLVNGLASFTRGALTPDLVNYCMEHGLPIIPSLDTYGGRLCSYGHPGLSCNAFSLRFVLRNVLQVGLPLYAPLKLIAIVALQPKKLRTHTVQTLLRGARSVLMSSFFLALYGGCFVRATCLSFSYRFQDGHLIAAFSFLAGLATLLESKGRRMDLALYCAMYAVRSFVLLQHRLGRLPYPKHWAILLTYLSSAGFIFHEYECGAPGILHSRVRNGIRLLLGDRPETCARDTNKNDSFLPGTSSPIPGTNPVLRVLPANDEKMDSPRH